MHVVVYVLCYDDTSAAAAQAAYANYPWARVVTLPDNPQTNRFMEGAAFLTTLPERRAEWESADFVGTLSWKAAEKIEVSLLDKVVNGVVASMDTQAGSTDVIALLPSSEALVRQALQCHPRFLEVWVPLLMHMGHSAQDAVSTNIPSFFCNYWLARPQWTARFLEFYAAAVHTLNTLHSIQEPLWSDAQYCTHLPLHRQYEVFGRPYITYHPFVCERLASFFFWKEGAVITLAPLGKKTFWQQYYAWEAQDVQNRADQCAKQFALL